MATPPENPYRAPQADAFALEATAVARQADWKSILRRWELLRIPFNVMVGFVGLLTLALFPPAVMPQAAVDAVIYGVLANAMYLLGPAIELYLNWMVESPTGRFVLTPVARLIQSGYTTALLFLMGSLFSVGVTLAIGLSEAFSAGIPNQQ